MKNKNKLFERINKNFKVKMNILNNENKIDNNNKYISYYSKY